MRTQGLGLGLHSFRCGNRTQRFTKNFGGRFMTMVERTHFTVFGNPGDELRGLLDQFDATYLAPFDDLK